ncbi:MAG: hypothetical protein ACO1OB_02110 [Archangium sp.]
MIDRAVASIEGRVIAASQLDFEARVLLIDAGGVNAAFAPLDQQVLDASLKAAIDQRLAVLEADKLEAYPLDDGELEGAIARFRARFESEERFVQFLLRHEAELVDLAEVLRRSLRAQKALEGKLRLRALVTDVDVRAYVLEHPDLKGTPLDKVKAMLVQKRFGELVREELAEQHRQHDVRLLGPYAPKQGVP